MQIFTEAGVVSIEHADFDGIERLAAVTGGEIASTFDRPDLSTLGECKLIDEIMVSTGSTCVVNGVKRTCVAMCMCVALCFMYVSLTSISHLSSVATTHSSSHTLFSPLVSYPSLLSLLFALLCYTFFSHSYQLTIPYSPLNHTLLTPYPPFTLHPFSPSLPSSPSSHTGR